MFYRKSKILIRSNLFETVIELSSDRLLFLVSKIKRTKKFIQNFKIPTLRKDKIWILLLFVFDIRLQISVIIVILYHV